jgi:hypothetical protein
MAYCPRCGVEVEERLSTCPLCETAIPEEVRERPFEPGEYPEDVIPPRPLYRKLTGNQKRVLIASLIVLLGFFPVALTTGIDYARNGAITWSWFVIVPVIGAAISAWIFVHYSRKPLISITAMLVIVISVLLLVSARVDEGSILQRPELPFFLASFIAVELVLLFITFRKPSVLQLLAFFLLVAAALIAAIELLVSAQLGWSLVSASSLLPVSFYLIYLRWVKKKGLNLAGFFFLDLTVMMLALDYTTSGTLRWSLVTTLIFLTISAIFYVLHVALFNDTDWRKALHF